MALAYAEESFKLLERKFGYTPARRVPLIVYASHADFEQTNLLPYVPYEGLLGVTEFLRRRVALPFNGNYAEFRHTLRHELVHFFQLSILSQVWRTHPRQLRPDIPLWWTEGLAELWSGGEDTRDQMVLRDLVLGGRLPTLAELAWEGSTVVYPLGGAIHRWLAATFGEWRVQQLYRDIWKYDSFGSALAGVFGRSMNDLNADLQLYLKRRYYPSTADRRPLELTADRLADIAVKPVAYRAPADSATQFLFLSPRDGYTNIYTARWRDPRSKPQTVVRGERSAEFESFHTFGSRLDVREGVVVFTSKYHERDALFLWIPGPRR